MRPGGKGNYGLDIISKRSKIQREKKLLLDTSKISSQSDPLHCFPVSSQALLSYSPLPNTS